MSHRAGVRIGHGAGHGAIEIVVGTVALAEAVHRRECGLLEVGGDQSWFDDDDLDPESGHLEPHGVRDRFHGVFGGVIDRSAGEDQPAAHRRDVDDPSGALGAHRGQDELAEPQQPEDVGLELAAHVVQVEGLGGSGLGVPGVVDERIDAADLAVHPVDGRLHGCLVRHVEGEGPTALGHERVECLGAACGGVDGPAVGGEARRSGLADAG